MVASLACLSLSLGVVAATVVVTPASANGEVTPSYVTMVDGASVRYSPNAADVYSGIRFEATVDSYYFDELEAGYTTGILVIPQSLLGENELTKNTPEVKDVSTIVWMEETETICSGKSYLELDNPKIQTSILKCAQNGEGWILRMYNASSEEQGATLQLGIPCSRCAVSDMKEKDLEAVEMADGKVSLQFRPWEIKTLRILR